MILLLYVASFAGLLRSVGRNAAIAVLLFLIATTFYWTIGVACLAIWFVAFPFQLFWRLRRFR